MALHDRDPADGLGNILARTAPSDRHGELTARLDGLAINPSAAAERLLLGCSTVVPIDRARRGGPKDPPVTPARWTIGLAFARWLARVSLVAVPSPPPGSTTDSPLREALLAAMRELETERMVAIFADDRGHVIAHDLVAEGNATQLRLSLRRVFAKALQRKARRMVLAHNHPSGCSEPSENDITSTLRLQSYAASLGIALEDHLIVGSETITSMRSLGLL